MLQSIDRPRDTSNSLLFSSICYLSIIYLAYTPISTSMSSMRLSTVSTGIRLARLRETHNNRKILNQICGGASDVNTIYSFSYTVRWAHSASCVFQVTFDFLLLRANNTYEFGFIITPIDLKNFFTDRKPTRLESN